MTKPTEFIEVRLREIQAAEGNGPQIVILGEVMGDRQFPIFIGPHEMEALDRALHGKGTPRPMTHDLILNAIEAMKGELVRALIDDLSDNTFFGKLVVKTLGGEEVWVDSRPSDALVLAALRSVPIFVAEQIIEEIARPPDSEFEE